jgi:hypothetical protein
MHLTTSTLSVETLQMWETEQNSYHVAKLCVDKLLCSDERNGKRRFEQAVEHCRLAFHGIFQPIKLSKSARPRHTECKLTNRSCRINMRFLSQYMPEPTIGYSKSSSSGLAFLWRVTLPRDSIGKLLLGATAGPWQGTLVSS